MVDLPTVELIDAAYYWVRPAYGDDADQWVVARWQHGCFWGARGQEISPRVISGPIAQPAQPDVGARSEQAEGEG